MFSEPAIRRLRVEAFRGFREPREFDLSASAIIITGPNGTGKTSFFDAMQWCLLGRIERLEDLRARRSVEHIVNQYRLSTHATVEMDMMVAGRQITLRRTGNHNRNTLEFEASGSASLFGKDAEDALEAALAPNDEVSLSTALTTSGLMQQDVMRAVLESKPADRYKHLSSVLGLAGLEDFETAVLALARDAETSAAGSSLQRDQAASAVADAHDRLATSLRRLQSLPESAALRGEIVSLASRSPSGIEVRLSEESIGSEDECRVLQSVLANVVDQMSAATAISREVRTLGDGLEAEPSEDEFASGNAARSTIRADVDARKSAVALVETRLDAARAASDDVARLAALAIPLLTHRCPVCGQSIDPAHVESELIARAADTGTMLSLQEELLARQQELRAAEAAARDSDAAFDAIQRRRAVWDSYRRAATEVTMASAALESSLPPWIEMQAVAFDKEESALATISYLRDLRGRIAAYVASLDRGAEKGVVDRAQSEAKNLEQALASLEIRAAGERQRALMLKSLAEGAVAARVEVTERRFSAVQPLVADIFGRLDPHPAFKSIEFQLDTYYRRGATSPVVTDNVEGVSADPLIVFSTSQANIAALSYFLAMGLSAGQRALPFILLDDPVQSMDDVNVLGFADLTRYLRRDRQVMISTHERRLARLLERKLAPRADGESTVVIEFAGWDRSGPSVRQRMIESRVPSEAVRVVGIAS